jgi:hypothetical protein
VVAVAVGEAVAVAVAVGPTPPAQAPPFILQLVGSAAPIAT